MVQRAGSRPVPLVPVRDSSFRAAVVGCPISHSRSPGLHLAAYEFLGVTGEYAAVDVQPQDLERFLGTFRQDPAWRGLSVTMPHKRAVLEFVDETHGHAAILGAVNTVLAVRTPEQPVKLLGYNTDVQGIISAMQSAGYGGSGHAAVLGGGGTAAAAVAALAALEVNEVTTVVRNPDKAASLANVAESLKVGLSVKTFEGILGTIGTSTAVISALPPHVADTTAQQLQESGQSLSGKILLDVAYDPWPSALAATWESLGGLAVSGLDMLIFQAAEQVLLFTGSSRSQLPGVINAMYGAAGLPQR